MHDRSVACVVFFFGVRLGWESKKSKGPRGGELKWRDNRRGDYMVLYNTQTSVVPS